MEIALIRIVRKGLFFCWSCSIYFHFGMCIGNSLLYVWIMVNGYLKHRSWETALVCIICSGLCFCWSFVYWEIQYIEYQTRILLGQITTLLMHSTNILSLYTYHLINLLVKHRPWRSHSFVWHVEVYSLMITYFIFHFSVFVGNSFLYMCLCGWHKF